MEAIEQSTYFLRGVHQRCHTPLSFLFDHLNGHTQSRKMGPPRAH